MDAEVRRRVHDLAVIAGWIDSQAHVDALDIERLHEATHRAMVEATRVLLDEDDERAEMP